MFLQKDRIPKEFIIPFSIFLVFLLAIVYDIISVNPILWVYQNMHTIIEVIGAVIAFIMFYFLSHSLKNNYPNAKILSLAFLSISIFNFFHSASFVDNSFVLYHNLASFFGGVFVFIFVILNLFDKKINLKNGHITSFSLIFFGIAILVIIYPQFSPKMIENNTFTSLSFWLNILSGTGFLFGFYYFSKVYVLSRLKIDFIFLNVFLLLSLSNLLFSFSEMWYMTWWLWHLLRLVGFIVLLLVFFIVMEVNELAIDNQLAEIKLINKKLNNYTFTISHDLKEPIRSIRTFSEFILEDNETEFDAKTKDYFERIMKASTRMALMIEDLLILSSVGLKDIEFSEISLNHLIEDVLLDIDELIKETGTQIEYKLLPTLTCQATWMKVVFLNLIQNSIKYRDKNKERNIIKIKYHDDPKFHYLCIEDNGIGIEEDQFSKIFQLFRRAYSKSDKTGSGAGLAIVEAIIEHHGGSIWVKESKINKGTTICFTIAKKRGIK